MRIILLSLAVVLLASALVSVVFLSSSSSQPEVFGHATNNQSGDVSIVIDDVLSVSLSNETINFGTCAINTTRGYALLDSSGSSTDANNEDCIGGLFPSYMVVSNIGNVLANISVTFNESGADFFDDSNSWLAYKTNNTPLLGGCQVGTYQDSFLNITIANVPYTACENLSFFSSQKEFALYLQAFVNASASGGGTLQVTFSAQALA